MGYFQYCLKVKYILICISSKNSLGKYSNISSFEQQDFQIAVISQEFKAILIYDEWEIDSILTRNDI